MRSGRSCTGAKGSRCYGLESCGPGEDAGNYLSAYSVIYCEGRADMTNWTTADIPSQEGRLALVTGANSGVGWQTALELARAGSEVILAVRSAEKGRMAVDGIPRLIPRARVPHQILDF